MPWIELAQVFSLTAATALTLVLVLWLIGIALRDISIIDMAFSAMVASLLFIAYWLTAAGSVISDLILLLVSIWAVRMSVYLIHRNWGHGEDPRYTKLRSWAAEGWAFHWLSLRKVFLMQGAVIWVLTLPQQIAMANDSAAEFGVLAAIGLSMWCVGFLFETIGDTQLSRFKADPVNQGKVMSSGLWRYTRHPNYFGELCQWWGLFVIATEVPWAWCGIVGPLLYSWLVINVTGQRTLDKKMAREKPEYAEYMRSTSGLIPRRPLRRVLSTGPD